MKRIIKGKLCNTETAKLIGVSEPYPEPDESWYRESLYVTKSGAYFMYGCGNWQSKYAQRLGNGDLKGGDDWELFASAAAARQWAEERLSAEDYIAAFGKPCEDDKSFLQVAISAAARAKLDAERDRTGETLGAIVDRAIMGM